MPAEPQSRSNGPVASPEAAGSSSLPPTPPQPDQSLGGLVKAVLASLFICPGFGHRRMGRPTAAWIVLGLFLVSFAWLGTSLNHLVQESVKQLQSHKTADPFAIMRKIETMYAEDPDVDQALKFLLLIYFGAPVELLWSWLRQPRQDR